MLMKTVILCGGRGIRLGSQVDYIPKGMVSLGHRPIIWHIMKRYALFGHSSFILALGKKGDIIRDYFANYSYYTNDVTLHLGKEEKLYHDNSFESEWEITMVDTGDAAMSGARIARCARYLEDDNFMVTYSDSIANIDIGKLIAFHKKSKKIATITGAIPPYREGEFIINKQGKLALYNASRGDRNVVRPYVNGGFMIFNKRIFEYLNSFNECKLETQIFPKLIQDGQLALYPHNGFWRWLDTERDYDYLNDLVERNEMFWLQK